MLKKKLKIHSTQLIHTYAMTEFEKEKEALNIELTNCRAKLLKLEEKEKQWEVDAKLLMDSEKDLKVKLAAKEKEFQEKCKEVENQSASYPREIDTKFLSKEMSWIGLKDTKLTKSKYQIKELGEKSAKEEQEKKKVDEKCQELIKQNEKLNKQVVGMMALQGARHMIWDKIISEADKFRPCLDFIANQEDSLKLAKKKVVIEKFFWIRDQWR